MSMEHTIIRLGLDKTTDPIQNYWDPPKNVIFKSLKSYKEKNTLT